MQSSRIKELAEKVERLARSLVSTRKENARLKKLLGSAEARIKKSAGMASEGANGSIPELTRRVERMKRERKIIKSKIEKMAVRLDKFYGEQ